MQYNFARHRMVYSVNEHLTISPVAAQCNGACGKRSSIECVHIDRCWPQKSWRWCLRSTLNLDSDKFRCFNHRDKLDNTVFLPKFRLVTLLQSRAGQPLVTVMCAISVLTRKRLNVISISCSISALVSIVLVMVKLLLTIF